MHAAGASGREGKGDGPAGSRGAGAEGTADGGSNRDAALWSWKACAAGTSGWERADVVL